MNLDLWLVRSTIAVIAVALGSYTCQPDMARGRVMDSSTPLSPADSVSAKNKDVVRRFFSLTVTGADSVDVITQTIAPELVVHPPAPTNLDPATGAEDGEQTYDGRTLIENLLKRSGGASRGSGIYVPGTRTVEIQSMVAEGDFVACRFILRAKTTLRNEPYENYYHFLFRLDDGRVAEIWEYVDTLYSRRMLWPSPEKKLQP